MQYGRLENGIIVNMPTSGMDENGCLFVLDISVIGTEKYALMNGYKRLIYETYPTDGKNYSSTITNEDAENIYLGWTEIISVPSEIETSIDELEAGLSDTMNTVDSLLTDFIPAMLV